MVFQGEYISRNMSPFSPMKRNPTGTFTATPSTGSVGVPTPVLLAWNFDLGVSASIDNGVGAVGISGSSNRPGIVATTTWTISITKLDGTVFQQQVTYTAS